MQTCTVVGRVSVHIEGGGGCRRVLDGPTRRRSVLSCCDLQGVGERVKVAGVQWQGYRGRVRGLQSAGSNALSLEEGGGISSARTVLTTSSTLR